MRFTGPDARAVAAGEITVQFRRWAIARVLAGRTYRTNAGRIDVTAVRPVTKVTKADARRAGRPSAEQLLAELPGDAAHPLWRIEFAPATAPDPRAALAADDGLHDATVADLTMRLDRLDRASSHGPWTRQYLTTIAERPGVRAPDLATSYGRETAPFKIDVRKLKNLGLTHSLAVGYELSPRGRAFLDRTGT
ncbi:hypothetical protein [Sporichthya sp.]|uniref:hypothetical protein n=1 Tax=Sporichthya sp. TaxID=65475 RepID=UPI0017E087AB|nr:hypothetical protein [Sporichthya sp.]MBA3745691.1 hypothetical protein [Sporichthya sp.]